MKTIGIATFYAERNYGAVLQAYALQEAIYACNCKAEFLQFHETIDHSIGSKSNKLLSRMQFLWNIKGNLNKYKQIKKASVLRDNLFSQFQRNFMNVSKFPIYDMEDAKAIADRYDAFVSGSDMVWTPMGQSLDFYFLTFVEREKRLSYAPSLTGTVSFSLETNEKMKEYLSGINSLCFRENEGAEYAKKLIGREVPVVVDPTLLLTKEEWIDKLKINVNTNNRYLLCYLFGKVSARTKRNVESIAKKYNLSIRYISLSYNDVLYEQSCNRTGAYGPKDFVEIFYNADFVVTNTFHGLMFSLIMEKPFVVLHRGVSNKWAKNEGRISNVLKLLECSDRYIEPEEPIDCKFLELDYEHIQSTISDARVTSKQYLENMLQSIQTVRNQKKPVNIGTVSRKTCTGCLACIDVCPKSCITKETDDEGFYIPLINKDICIECSLCTSVCPALTTNNEDIIEKAFASFAKMDVKDSASGGMFITIAKNFINKHNGVVAGCIFDENMNVKHVIAETIDELKAMQNSKYVQSDTEGIYKKVQEYLQNGRNVLFSGTPCQVSAVKKICKSHKNLITIDIVCHGVPSPGFWARYISSFKAPVSYYKFRNRENKKDCRTTYYLKAKVGHDIIEKLFSRDIFYNSFIKAINYRYSCYYCNYANLKREGDLTIGDCDSWNYDMNPYPFESRSFISVNTQEGNTLFESIKDDIETCPIDISKEAFCNEALTRPTVLPALRHNFYASFYNLPYKQFVNKYQKKSILLIAKQIVSKIVNKQ